jgi:hypothetical protein
MHEFYGDIWDPAPGGGRAALSVCCHACEGLAALCGNYASMLDEVHSAMLRKLAEAGGAMGITDIIGGVIDVFSAGSLTGLLGELDATEIEDILGPLQTRFSDEASAEINAGGTASLEGELETAERSAPDVPIAEADTVSADDVEEEELAEDGSGDQGGGGPPVLRGPGSAPEPWHGPDDGPASDPAVVADRIATHIGKPGHAHKIPDVPDEEVPEYIEHIISQDGYRLRDSPNGYPRMAWWDPKTGTIIIRNGNDGSTFIPKEGYKYFVEQVLEE